MDGALARFDRAIVIDAHSFPSRALPYEGDAERVRPEICVGSDEFHSPPELVDAVVRLFESFALAVAVNFPFSGALVPLKHYRKDRRVSAVMIEVRRDLYMDEHTGERSSCFAEVSNTVRHCINGAILALTG